MKRCMYCGHVNDDSADSCVMCGNRLLEASDHPDAAQETGDEASAFMPEEPAADLPAPGEGVTPGPAQEIPGSETQAPQEIPVPQEAPAQQDIPVQQEAPDSDVHRGESYAASQQYSEPAQGIYGGQDYSYHAQEGGDQQYGGQAYGYQESSPYAGDGSGQASYGAEEDEPEDGAGPLQRKARKMVKSFLFFLPMLLYTAAFVASVLNGALGNARINLTTLANTLTNQFGSNMVTDLLNTGVNWVMQQNVWLVNGVFLLRCIPAFFIMIGLWMAFLNTSAKKEEISTAGYTLIRVIEILKFIVTCILLLGGIALAVVYVVAAGAAAETMSLIIGVIVLLVAILLSVFVIMYYLQLIFSLKVIRENVRSGYDRRRIPGFVIFIGLVGCLLCVALMLPMAPDDYIGLVYRGATAAWMLLFCLWTVIYRIVVKVK